MLVAKFAAPSSSKPAFHRPILDRVSENPLTLFNAPSGYLSANYLADELSKQDRNLMWLRVDEQDRDPATFLLSLIDSIRHFLPEFGSSTLLKMQQSPGPIAGWAPLYALLAQELAEVTSKIECTRFRAYACFAGEPTHASFSKFSIAIEFTWYFPMHLNLPQVFASRGNSLPGTRTGQP